MAFGDTRVANHDNRADGKSYAFGFVYFNDGRRVAYTADEFGVPTIHAQVTGGRDYPTGDMIADAQDYLAREFGTDRRHVAVNND
jgi:hypothetical protein